MLTFFIYFLTAVLVLDCLFLILLVLVQLPKKEAGMGQAFGGAATDALFGAGSGNALTKMTKYATVIFLLLTMFLSVLNAQHAKSIKSRFSTQVQSISAPPPPLPANPTVPAINTNLVTNLTATATNAAPAG